MNDLSPRERRACNEKMRGVYIDWLSLQTTDYVALATMLNDAAARAKRELRENTDAA